MALTESQTAIWKEIAQVYEHWAASRECLMPVRELAAHMPGVAPDMIGDTLAQAASERIAEVEHVSEDPCFRPLPEQRFS